MKKSKIKRLVPKKLAAQLVAEHRGNTDALQAALSAQGADTISKLRTKGYELVTCLESGEGVFVREEEVVGLHIQLPEALYQRLDAECIHRGATKRSLVAAALEAYLK
ncbi:MAG: hypothetical protein H6817_12105 [Phycisphaerales bacterium]|nr:hypothetical protein [Phycisphaerales bacterium]